MAVKIPVEVATDKVVSKLIRNAKVAKADDAAVPTYLWRDAIRKFGNTSLTVNDEEKLTGYKIGCYPFG